MTTSLTNSDSLMYDDIQKKDMIGKLICYYNNKESKYGKGDGLATGKIEKMFGKPGGGEQHDMPFGMDVLQDIGMIQKV